jgi:protein MpaA
MAKRFNAAPRIAAFMAAVFFSSPVLPSERLPLASVHDACRLIADRLGSVSLADCDEAGMRAADTATIQGLPILYRDYLPQLGNARDPVRVLLIGGIHGDELSSVSVVFRFMEQLRNDRFQNLHWRVAPLLNPDGLLMRPAQRMNARGVDLNRNFPSPDWKRAALPYWERRTGSDPRRYPGPDALSEPESRWLAQQIEQFAPDVVVSMHAPLGLLDFDGVAPPPDRLGFLRLRRLGTYPGSLGNWAGEYLRIPVFTPELPHAGIMPTGAQVLRIWADLRDWIQVNIQPSQVDPLLEAMQAGETPRQPLLLDAIGEAGLRPVSYSPRE